MKKLLGAWMSRPFTQGLVMTALLGAAFVSLASLPVTFYPNTRKPAYSVNLHFPGVAAEDVRENYSKLIEPLLQRIEDFETIESAYRDGSAEFTVEFPWSANADVSEQAVRDVFNTVRSSLPEESQRFWVQKSNRRSTGFFASMFISDKYSKEDLYNIVHPRVKIPLEKFDDVNYVWLSNPSKKETVIQLDKNRLAASRLNIADVKKQLNQALKPFSAGTLNREGMSSAPLRLPSRWEDLESIRRTRIQIKDNQYVTLGSLANIYEKRDNRRVFRSNGQDGVLLYVSPEAGGNLSRLCENIRNHVAMVLKTLNDPSIKHEILVDPSFFIEESVRSVSMAVLIGAFFTIFTLALFVRQLKAMMIISLSIPLSVLLAIPILYMLGVSINLISLGGLTIAIGMIVDASIVIFENILKNREEQPDRKFRDVILESTNQLWIPVASATLTTIVVFLPLSQTSALTFALLGDLARIVSVVLMTSLLVAFFVVPSLIYILCKSKTSTSLYRPKTNALIKRFGEKIGQAIRHLSPRPMKVFCLGLGSLVLLGGAVSLAFTLRQEIVAPPKTNKFWLNRHVDSSQSPEEMLSHISEGEKHLRSRYGDKITATFSQIWSNTGGSILVSLKGDNDFEKIEEDLRDTFGNTDFMRQNVYPWNPSELPLPKPAQIRFFVDGKDKVEALHFADQLKAKLENADLYKRGLNSSPGTDLMDKITVLRSIEADKVRGAPSSSDLSTTLQLATTRQKLGSYFPGGKEQDIYVEVPSEQIKTLEHLSGLPWFSRTNPPLPLSHFGEFNVIQAPQGFFYLDGRSTVRVEGFTKKKNKDKKDVYFKQAKEIIGKVTPPDGIAVRFDDPNVDFNLSRDSLLVSLAFSLLGIFLVLAFQFQNLVLPFLIMAAIPLGVIGVVPALKIFDSTLSLNSLLGTIILGGIVVNNSILIVDLFIRNRRQNMDTVDSIVDAVQRRLRPVLMTSFTTCLGMLPIALGLGSGGETVQPLGIAVCFGLLISTSLTLIVVPTLICFASQIWAHISAWIRPKVPYFQ